MIDEIMSLAVGNGIWTALFCFLFLYMLKDTRNREAKYNSLIENLNTQLDKTTSALKICEAIKNDCEIAANMSVEIRSNTECIREGLETLRATMERL